MSQNAGETRSGVRRYHDGLGKLRIAEHFTVRGGHIVRLRQIHDPVAIGTAGLGT